MKKLTRKQKIENITKAFKNEIRASGHISDKGYIHSFVDKKDCDMFDSASNEQTNDYVRVSYYKHNFSDKKKFRIRAGSQIMKRTVNNRIITKNEPYDWFLTTEDAENLICFLEAFIEVEKEQEKNND